MNIFEVLIALAAIMVIIAIGAFSQAFFAKHLRDKLIAGSMFMIAGFIAFSLIFLSDPWVQDGMRAKFLSWFS